MERLWRGIVYIATSADGYIARPDGGIGWLTEPDTSIQHAGEVAGPGIRTAYDDMIARVDALIMGRRTYEKVLTFDEWPYPIPVIVLSKTLPEIADDRASVVRSLAEAVDAANAMDAKGVYVDGGQTIQTFLRADLIDEITVTRAPVLIGSGFPLFGELDQDVKLRLEHVESQDGYLMARYQVVR
ncbi:MAG TPA: dihydrofolate reductase family protein [Actinomycetes bacterium]|nr:dihydrofolate reductase family protein [Actinomycetes bacterium]